MIYYKEHYDPTIEQVNPEYIVKLDDEQPDTMSVIPNTHRHYQDYLDWVAEGNTALAYVAPPEPPPLTTEQKVNNLLSDYGLTRDEMRAALSVKASTMPKTIE